MIANDEQLERAEKAAATLKIMLRQSRKTMSPAAYERMSRPWLLELQEREREVLIYLANLEIPQPAATPAK
jgi:hypothetical protein